MGSPLKITRPSSANNRIDVLAAEANNLRVPNVCQLTIHTLQGKYEGFFVSNVTTYSLEDGKIILSFNEQQIT